MPTLVWACAVPGKYAHDNRWHGAANEDQAFSAAAAGLYFAVPHASVLVKAPAEFSNTVLQVHKNIMAA